jgi:hypothetical protein
MSQKGAKHVPALFPGGRIEPFGARAGVGHGKTPGRDEMPISIGLVPTKERIK